MDAARALDLLQQCAGQLARTGGMVNKDLAKEVTAFVAEQRRLPTPDQADKVGAN